MKNRNILMWALAILVIFFIYSKTTSMYSASDCPSGYPNYNPATHECTSSTLSGVASWTCRSGYTPNFSSNATTCVPDSSCVISSPYERAGENC